ncbi:MAG TPA: response regulator [Nitrososphaeraceae archaeon]|jgi:CheY-like chemotaxis protein
MKKVRDKGMKGSDEDNKTSRILLVDDETDSTSLFRTVLEDLGFVVDVFNDSPLALSNFKPGFYELLILDIRMPKMDGLELCREIRKLDDKVKVCFLTASEIYNENLRTSLHELDQNARIRCFISKPVGLDDFVKRIKQELD